MIGFPIILAVRCSNCGFIQNVAINDCDVQDTVQERSMGPELYHHCYGQCECIYCNNSLDYSVCVYEYPIGAIETVIPDSCSNCQIIEPRKVQIDYGETFGYYEFSIPVDVEEEISLKTSWIINNMNIDPNSIFGHTPYEFEKVVAEVFRRHGFRTTVTKRSGDGGYDVIATCVVGGIPYTTLIECKQYTPGKKKVDVSIVRSLAGVRDTKNASKAVVVTTSSFTKPAQRFAEYNQLIELIDFDKLMEMIRDP